MTSRTSRTSRSPRIRTTGSIRAARPTRNRLAAALAAGLLAAVAGGTASAAPLADVQPQAVPGKVLAGGADGTPRTVMCPPEESAMGGGFAVSAPHGRTLDDTPADVLESRPTADATGWTVSVRRFLVPDHDGHGPGPGPRHRADGTPDPADLTVYVVCTQGENTPGG